MSLVAHLSAADVKRSPALYASAALVIAVSTAFTGLRPALAPDPGASDVVPVAGSLLTYLEVLLSIVIVARVVQADPLVGTTGFWMTRPIPPPTLLASKALVLGGPLVVIPVVTQLTEMWVYGVPAGAMTLATVQTLGVRTLWLTVLMSGAALTGSLFAFSLLAATVGAAVSLAINVGIAILTSGARSALEPVLTGPVDSPGDSANPLTLVPLVAISVVALAILLIVQYRTREMRRSVPAGAGGMAIACAIVLVWPWHAGAPQAPPDWSAGLALELAGGPAKTTFQTRTADPAGETLVAASMPLRVRGIPRGWRAALQFSGGSVDLGSVRLMSPGVPIAAPVMDDRAGSDVASVLADVLGVQAVGPPLASSESPSIVLLGRAGDLRAQAGRTARYEGRFRVHLTHVEAVGTLPLRRGATFQDADYRIVVDGFTLAPEIVHVLVHTSTVSTAFDRRPGPEYSLFLRSTDHRVASRARPLRTYDLLGSGLWPGLGEAVLPQGFDVRQFTAVVLPLANRPDPRSPEAAELVVVREATNAPLARSLTVQNFRMPEVK